MDRSAQRPPESSLPRNLLGALSTSALPVDRAGEIVACAQHPRRPDRGCSSTPRDTAWTVPAT